MIFLFQLGNSFNSPAVHFPGCTLSPIIMVQWKMANYLKVTTFGDTPIFDFHDYLGGGFKPFFIFTPIWGRFPF